MQLKNFQVIWVTDCPFARFLRAPIHRFGRVAKGHPPSALNGPYVSFATSARSTSGVWIARNDEMRFRAFRLPREGLPFRISVMEGFHEKLQAPESGLVRDRELSIVNLILKLQRDRTSSSCGSLLEIFPCSRRCVILITAFPTDEGSCRENSDSRAETRTSVASRDENSG